MIEVYPSVFVGSGDDYDLLRASNETGKPMFDGWLVISASKEPWHREALGYTGRAAPNTHPEYLVAVRPNRLILNLIDADNPAYIPDEIVHTALDTIDTALGAKTKVLIHCNQGQSRAPTLALLWLRWGKASVVSYYLRKMSYDDAAEAFRGIYPPFAPAGGMEGYARAHWEDK